MEKGLVTRDDVAIPWADCNSCGVGTRSHLLEPALYQEYITQQIIDQSDEYASKQWEDVEDVVKVELAEKPIVLCHKCWVKKQNGLDQLISRKYEDWLADPLMHVITIQRILKTYQYYKFEIHADKIQTLLSTLKRGIRGEEE
jgi:hypothetical protein